MIHPLHAVLLGVVEGLTEFLPVSSTGHLILTSQLFGLRGDAVNSFEVIIQAGALGAVLGLYRTRIQSMWRGLFGREASGSRLLRNLLVSFLPAAIVGVACHRVIKQQLFDTWPVVLALAAGGLLMVVSDRWLAHRVAHPLRTLESLTMPEAFVIGIAQCFALWPGTSRSMVTIMAALALGLPTMVAAEYSFLLALPTLGAATLFDALSHRTLLLHSIGGLSILCGFVAAAVVAAISMRGLLHYLTRRGLAPFGWYRLALATIVWILVPHH